MVVFKIRDSVPSARYSSVCNVLRLWNILLIPTYRIYRLYDSVEMHLKVSVVCLCLQIPVGVTT